MPESRRSLGFPSNQVKGSDWKFFAGCGGSGAGTCFEPASFSYIYWPIKVNPFSVHNTKLVLHNDIFAPHIDTPTGICAHNSGAVVAYDVLLLHSEPITLLDRTLATGVVSVPSTLSTPFDIEFDAVNLPQPQDPNYERKIWVALDMHNTGYMISGLPQLSEVMQTVKFNWEGQP